MCALKKVSFSKNHFNIVCSAPPLSLKITQPKGFLIHSKTNQNIVRTLANQKLDIAAKSFNCLTDLSFFLVFVRKKVHIKKYFNNI